MNANAQVISDKSGYALSAPGVTAIANSIWNSLTSGYTAAGSFGLLLGTGSSVVSPSSVTAIVNGVWNALSASYVGAGSMGAILSALNTNVSLNLNTLASQASVNSLATAVAGLATQASLSAVFPILGTPVNGSLAADITQVKSDTGTINSRLTAMRAANLDNLNASIAALATQTSINSILGLIGTPLTSVSGDIAAVKADTFAIASNYTAGRAAKLDNLDAAVSSVASQALLTEVYELLGTPAHTTVSADVAALATVLATLPTASAIWAYTTRSLNTTVNANVNLSALATASQLAAAEAAILAAINAFEVVSSVSLDPNSGIATALVWLTLSNATVPNPDSATAQIYNSAGSLILDLGSQTSATPGGVFEFQQGGASAVLPANQSFTLRTSVTMGSNTFNGTKAFTTFA